MLSGNDYNKPHEVLYGRLGEEEDEIKDMINYQPRHVLSITQVLTLNTQHNNQHSDAAT